MEDAATASPVAPDLLQAMHAPEGGDVWVEQEGQVVNFWTFVVCALLIWLLLPAIYAIWRWALTNAHVYRLTTQRLTETSGLLSKDTQTLELYRVKDIAIEQPFMQRMFGRGRVVMVTSDRSTPRVVLSAISQPQRVASIIRDHVERARVTKGVREID
jgi:uncharacterized membrane protein YdbT with pleckstrin-like domain